ncbi:hypothetical protein HYW82_01020, partial [Candidatus Peregrinibacteria bacterium]|nr:hypothetical protein [Candidatus Peregrinibacteria bacterium]
MRRQQGPVDYVLPFLIIVCVGIILILVWNLWKALFGEDTTRAAYLHVIDGSAQMKTWNTDDYFSLSTDVVVRQGDEISVSNGSKVIVEFFDGTIMRMGGGSTVRFDLLDDKNDNPQLEISLLDGMIWINKIYKGTAETGLSIDLADIIVDSRAAGIFEVESGEDMAVRIFDVFNEDGVLVEILEKGGDKVVEEENVGVGQEVVLNDKILERYWQHQSPSVLAAVSDEFKQGDWYKWNVAEDTKPTVFEKFAGVDGAGLVKVEPEEVVGNGEIVEPE